MSSGAPAFIQWLSLAGASFSRKESVVNYRDDKRRGLDVGAAPATLL